LANPETGKNMLMTESEQIALREKEAVAKAKAELEEKKESLTLSDHLEQVSLGGEENQQMEQVIAPSAPIGLKEAKSLKEEEKKQAQNVGEVVPVMCSKCFNTFIPSALPMHSKFCQGGSKRYPSPYAPDGCGHGFVTYECYMDHFKHQCKFLSIDDLPLPEDPKQMTALSQELENALGQALSNL
jgi:hypothetical protein